jgi:hypothetical protein
LAKSGGQFPVAAVVYEDIIPGDGVYEIYCFRDGVTVEVEGVPHRGTTPMTPEQIAASIDGKVKRVFTYARIASTSPKMWIDAGGSADVLKDGKPTENGWPRSARRYPGRVEVGPQRAHHRLGEGEHQGDHPRASASDCLVKLSPCHSLSFVTMPLALAIRGRPWLGLALPEVRVVVKSEAVAL